MKNVNIELIKTKSNNFKQYDFRTEQVIMDSISKYGQLKPLIVQAKDEKDIYELVEGRLLLKCMKEAGFNDVYIIEVDPNLNELELFDLLLKLDKQQEVNILTVSQKISDLLEDYTIEEITLNTNLKFDQVQRYKQITDIKYRLKAKDVFITKSLFTDED